MAGRGRTKSIEQSIADTDEPDTRLRRDLSWWHLCVFGVSVVIGAGIFTVTASTAGDITGPAIWISFLIAAVTCGLAALCYAEFASMLPVAGSAYTFSYATFGEFLAWTIGWNLVLELAIGGAVVAKGWSSYLGTVFGFVSGTVESRLGDAGLGCAADRRAGGHPAGTGHQVVVAVLHGGHRRQGVGGGAGDRRRRLLHQGRELLAVHPAARGRPERLRHQSVAAVVAHRRAQQPLRLVRGSRGRLDRVLRVHRVRHRGDHGRGDQEPAARRPAGHPGDAGHRHRPLCGGVGGAVRDGSLHRLEEHPGRSSRQPRHRFCGQRRALGFRNHLDRRARRTDDGGDGAPARRLPGVVRDGARRAVASATGQDRRAWHAGADHRAGRVAGRADSFGVPDRTSWKRW